MNVLPTSGLPQFCFYCNDEIPAERNVLACQSCATKHTAGLEYVYGAQDAAGLIMFGLTPSCPTEGKMRLGRRHSSRVTLLSWSIGTSWDVARIRKGQRAHHVNGGWYKPAPSVLYCAENIHKARAGLHAVLRLETVGANVARYVPSS